MVVKIVLEIQKKKENVTRPTAKVYFYDEKANLFYFIAYTHMFTNVVTYIYTQLRLTVNGVNMGNGAPALNPVVEDFKLGQGILNKPLNMVVKNAKEHQQI